MTLISAHSPATFLRSVASRGLGLIPKMPLTPTVNHTGHEPGGELCEIFKFWSFLPSKSVNNVCKLLQLLWKNALPGLGRWTPPQHT